MKTLIIFFVGYALGILVECVYLNVAKHIKSDGNVFMVYEEEDALPYLYLQVDEEVVDHMRGKRTVTFDVIEKHVDAQD